VNITQDMPQAASFAQTPGRQRFADDVITGLSAEQKALPCVWLYDHAGSALFEQITGLPEYYPTRTETRMLAEMLPDIRHLTRQPALLIEPGSGSGRKTRLLLSAWRAPLAYVPVDVSETFMLEATSALARDYPEVKISPVVGDFTQGLNVPRVDEPYASAVRVGFFPGSSIGNFTPEDAVQLLTSWRRTLGDKALLLIGVDTTQDPARLVPAYDDAAGVTAQFNLNLLARINHELDGTFDLGGFEHRAYWNEAQGRIEMHLVSVRRQRAMVMDRDFAFAAGEYIHTENAYKYTADRFLALAAKGGWAESQRWTDRVGSGFTLFLLQAT